MKLIFAQGNPEPDYAGSRHNVGFMVVNNLAETFNAKWSTKTKFLALVAEVTLSSEKVLLVKPLTFYNDTGLSAQKIINFYTLDLTRDLLVIHDDLALPFGTLRVREKGSDAGNNGIKSLNAHLGPNYRRIRIGTGNDLRDRMNDADFVLSKFSKEESEKLASDIIPQVTKMIEDFCHDTLETTSHKL